MIKIRLFQDTHRGEDRIFCAFPLDLTINPLFRQFKPARWSRSRQLWHLPLNKALVEDLAQLLQGKALLDDRELTWRKSSPQQGAQAAEGDRGGKSARRWPEPVRLCAANRIAYDEFMQTLTLKAYSSNTIRTYRNEFLQFLHKLGDIPAYRLQKPHIARYLRYCFEKEGLHEHTVNSRLNAIKFYYEKVLQRERMLVDIPRPKKPLDLPKVLSEAELGRLFRSVRNLKHKAILFTAYSAGLRVSEVVNLRLQDIDSDRMQIFVKCSKGKKDRYVVLSPVLLDILRSYIRQSQPRPRSYLFEGTEPGVPYAARTAQRIFQEARSQAGIRKQVGFHALRHSFATHLLEKGLDIRYIKELLGHFNIKTTERYLHVRKEHLVNIISPLDDLFARGELDW